MIVPPTLPEGGQLLIIGQCPGKDEAREGRPFVGRDGKQLREWLLRVGINPTEVAFDNVHRDFNGDPTYKPTTKETKAGHALCKALIEQIQPKVVLLLGGPASQMVFKGGITKSQGRMETTDGVTYTCAFHPGYYRNAMIHNRRQGVEAENDILAVFSTVAAILRGEKDGTPALPEGKYVNSMDITEGEHVAIDVETWSEKDAGDPRIAEYLLCATSPTEGGMGAILMTDKPRVHPGATLDVHNVPYDGVSMGIWDCKWGDSKMLAHMAGEPDTTLKGLALRFLDRPMLTYPEAVRLGCLPEYCLSDAEATRDLMPVLRECLDASVLRLYDDLEAPLFPLWTKMTLDGAFYLDHDALSLYATELQEKVNRLRVEVEDMLPRGRTVKYCIQCQTRQAVKGQRCLNGNHRWKSEYRDDEPVNLNSPSQLLPALQSLGIPIMSTRAEEVAEILENTEVDVDDIEFDDALSELAGAYPVLRVLMAYRKAHKELSTYILPWMSTTEGSRLGCIWNPHGTWTGRISSRGPNLQNVPVPLWRFFHAGEGHTLLSFDHSQLELRLAAHVAQDPYMISVYRDGVDGGDMHSATMTKLGLTDRRLAKVFNFGTLYDTHGTGAGFQQNARKYGVKLDARQIMYAQRDMRQLIPGYMAWQQTTMHKRVIDGLFGMKHYVPQGGKETHRENEAVNAPIQGGGALITKYGMLALHRAGYEVVAQVHDSITVRVPNADVEEAKHDIAALMETAIPEPLLVPLLVEVK